jgi:hypothetical protein
MFDQPQWLLPRNFKTIGGKTRQNSIVIFAMYALYRWSPCREQLQRAFVSGGVGITVESSKAYVMQACIYQLVSRRRGLTWTSSLGHLGRMMVLKRVVRSASIDKTVIKG